MTDDQQDFFAELKHVDATVLCRLLGLGERRLQQLAEEDVIVRVSEGKYDFEASVAGYVGFLRQRINHYRRRGHRARKVDLMLTLAELLREEEDPEDSAP
jgi:hypothetical protein